MIKAITKIVLLLCAMLSPMEAFSQIVPVTPEYGDDENTKDLPNHGIRMPPAPIMVVVDVEAGTLTGASPLLDGIVRYEIWDADGNLCIASASDAATALKAINDCHGTYLLRLRGDGYTLTGYIDL